jgi:DNA circularisation protein N-terminus
MSRSACAIDKDVVPASFKGVGFWCTEADIEGGRRGAEGEFPFGEDTAYADLGRKIRVFHLTAVFREDNHVWDAQALFEACQSPGPGMLVHPTRGTHMAACRSVKIKDSLEESAGETTAELEFVEANMGFGGLIGSLFGIISSGLFAASETVFLRDYRPTHAANPWAHQVIDTTQHLVAKTAQVSSRVLVSDSPPVEWKKIYRMGEIATDNGLAAVAENVNNALVDGYWLITMYDQDPYSKFNRYRSLANATPKPSNPPYGAAKESEEAILGRHRVLAAIGMAEAAMGKKYVTIHEALATMDMVNVVLEDEAKLAYSDCDNVLFMELEKYSIQFSKMMNDIAYRLPGVVRVDFGGGVHPLVASYAIYKDAKRHRELEERNIIDANGRFGPIVSGVSPV